VFDELVQATPAQAATIQQVVADLSRDYAARAS
jgi:hypothetical protein